MFLWKKPTRAFIDAFIAAQAKLDFSYAHPGASAGRPPSGFVLDETCTRLGSSEPTFARATAALGTWRHFQLGWVEPCWSDTPIEPGRTVAILAHALGMWSLNACRIIEVIDVHSGPVRTFGFVYGTLPDHVESGEERFLIEWNLADNSVWYTIRAISRPRHFLAHLGYPLVRRLQKQFARMSSAAMLAECSG
jgi:uncharacterized protein (UPF0548 family)